MKKIFALPVLILLAAICPVFGTTFTQRFLNPDGTAQTNAFTFTAYPPASPWFIVGTNTYFGGQTATFTPDATGYVSNSVAAGSYTVLFSNLNSGFYVTIPNTTNIVSLSACATGVPTISGTAFDGYGLVTNWLGFPPATNSYTCIIFNLGYTPATNSAPGVISALGYMPATNSPPGIISALGYTPATNAPVFLTGSNPTNQFVVNVIYTNAGNRALLFGFASGTILHWTNNSLPFVLPVTNDFCVPLSTNATFKFDNSGWLTNSTLWNL